ncbi:MAG: MoaD/ThiS family protein [Deltaproteobacteria bacterium]|jgi:hypothetical protein|nr:MoaD/ThiS family protein [Deltaproteobacteria bacterium]
MPIVIVPEAYRGPTRGLGEIEVEGGTVRECIAAVEVRHPGFGELCLTADGEAHRFVKLFLNEEQLMGDVLDQKLGANDRLEVLAAIAGG